MRHVLILSCLTLVMSFLSVHSAYAAPERHAKGTPLSVYTQPQPEEYREPLPPSGLEPPSPGEDTLNLINIPNSTTEPNESPTKPTDLPVF